MNAAYVFRVRFHLDPAPDVDVSPERFETTMERSAAEPGQSGWLFFRDNLWRGEVNEPSYQREQAEAALGVPVDAVEFRELRTDREYRDALEAAIADELDSGTATFGNAETVERVVTNYLGSSVHVRPEDT
ncbi:LWR-salt protein [Halomarina salina]|uniref:LWR-salt protein n=1 Tax=Halomarina salina TaxID=1872699 RepID=A0ABD5RQB0_9EURY|nr:LWR-salt protein [Halomarina salina]